MQREEEKSEVILERIHWEPEELLLDMVLLILSDAQGKRQGALIIQTVLLTIFDFAVVPILDFPFRYRTDIIALTSSISLNLSADTDIDPISGHYG